MFLLLTIELSLLASLIKGQCDSAQQFPGLQFFERSIDIISGQQRQVIFDLTKKTSECQVNSNNFLFAGFQSSNYYYPGAINAPTPLNSNDLNTQTVTYGYYTSFLEQKQMAQQTSISGSYDYSKEIFNPFLKESISAAFSTNSYNQYLRQQVSEKKYLLSELNLRTGLSNVQMKPTSVLYTYLKQDFIQAINELPSSYSSSDQIVQEIFFQFFDQYGTGYINSGILGGELNFIRSMNECFTFTTGLSLEQISSCFVLDFGLSNLFTGNYTECEQTIKKINSRDQIFQESSSIQKKVKGGTNSLGTLIMDSSQKTQDIKLSQFQLWANSVYLQPALITINQVVNISLLIYYVNQPKAIQVQMAMEDYQRMKVKESFKDVKCPNTLSCPISSSGLELENTSCKCVCSSNSCCNKIGTLYLSLRDTWFISNDNAIYLKIFVNQVQVAQSSPARYTGGSKPCVSIQEDIQVPGILPGSTIEIQVWDDDTATTDDFLGSTQLQSDQGRIEQEQVIKYAEKAQTLFSYEVLYENSNKQGFQNRLQQFKAKVPCSLARTFVNLLLNIIAFLTLIFI